MLTQERVLEVLQRAVKESNRIPTLREMAAEFGQRTTSSIRRILERLEQQGFLQREANAARAIQLTAKGMPPTGLPILGRIAAGVPTEAIEAVDHIDLGAAYDSARHFGLIVKGSSMIDAHIVDGDIAVIRRQETCNDGEIVAAVINGEATLKRFYRRKDHVLLKPANKRMKPIQTRDVEIRGVLVAVIRQAF